MSTLTAGTPGETFGARLARVVEERGRLCVGIDPHAALLASWGLPDSAAGIREFGLRVVEASAGTAGIVKPQIGFFERHGSAGFAALEEVLAAARAAELLVIADVKRGDVGSSVDAYGQAWLTPGSPFEADAMTAVAYQGVGSLDGVLAQASSHGKGVFVLAATSNPEATDVQTARVQSGPQQGRTVAAATVAELQARRTESSAAAPLDEFCVVVGATVDLGSYGLTPEDLARTPILAPGFGHQGASFVELPTLFGPALPAVIASASRSILSAGPDGLAAAVSSAAAEVDAACRA